MIYSFLYLIHSLYEFLSGQQLFVISYHCEDSFDEICGTASIYALDASCAKSKLYKRLERKHHIAPGQTVIAKFVEAGGLSPKSTIQQGVVSFS